ncbi:MAG: isochorismatase family protein [Neisseria sp.]|nr:isochorismatase family protein [Neisseria sp.]
MQIENTVCIVVDIQERLTAVLHEADDFVEKSSVLLQGLNALGIAHIITEQYPKGLGNTLAQIKELCPDSPVIEKTRFSAFLSEVEAFLQQKQAKNVIIIGAEAHVCMLQTVQDLQAAGYTAYIPFECTTSRSPLNKANALQQMQAAGAVVSNVESLLFALLEDAKHPAFKTISKLIQ